MVFKEEAQCFGTSFFLSTNILYRLGSSLLNCFTEFSEGKGRNRAKRRPLLLAGEYASVLTVDRMTGTSQRAGTEEGTCPGWGQNQLLTEDFTALPVSVKPGP